jgi:hypothetical protein
MAASDFKAIITLLQKMVASGTQLIAASGALVDGSSNNAIIASGVGSPVNQLTVNNAATATSPVIKATGSDTNVGFRVQVKGNGIISLEANVIDGVSVASVSTAGNATLTAAQILGGLILRDGGSANRTDTTPTAAQLVAAAVGVQLATGFEFVIRNAQAATYTLTLAAGTGVTLSPTTITIAPGTGKQFLAVFNNVTSGTEAVTIYSLTSGTY